MTNINTSSVTNSGHYGQLALNSTHEIVCVSVASACKCHSQAESWSATGVRHSQFGVVWCAGVVNPKPARLRPALPQDWVQTVDERAADSGIPTSGPSPSLPHPTTASIDTTSVAAIHTKAPDSEDVVPAGVPPRQPGSNQTVLLQEQADISHSDSVPDAPQADTPTQQVGSLDASLGWQQEPDTELAAVDAALAEDTLQQSARDAVAPESMPPTVDGKNQDRFAPDGQDAQAKQAAQHGSLPVPAPISRSTQDRSSQTSEADGVEFTAQPVAAPINRSTQDQSSQTREGDSIEYAAQSGPLPIVGSADMPWAAAESHQSPANQQGQDGRAGPESTAPKSAAMLSLEAMIPPPFEFGSPTGSPNFPTGVRPAGRAVPEMHAEFAFQNAGPLDVTDTARTQGSGNRLEPASEAADESSIMVGHASHPQQAIPPPSAEDTSYEAPVRLGGEPSLRRLASSEVQRRIEQTAVEVQQVVNERGGAESYGGGVLEGGPSDALARATGTLRALVAGQLEEAESLSRGLPTHSGESCNCLMCVCLGWPPVRCSTIS